MDQRIDSLQRRSAADESVIGLGGGLPDEATFPVKDLERAFRKALSQDVSCLQYGWPEGRDSLREFIAARLTSRGAQVAARDVIITSGAQQAIALSTQACCDEGDSIAVDAETYPAALELFRAQNLRLVDSSSAAAAVYTLPAMSNPHGRVMPSSERSLLAQSGRWLVEDDAYAELTFGKRPGPPLLAERPERVLHIGTFSKTLCPGLRVGWLIVPPSLRDKALSLKHAVDLQANSLAQAILEQYLAETDFEARLDDLSSVYAARAEQLLDALRRHLPQLRFQEPKGGFSIWAETELVGDDADFLAECLRHGVSVDPGRDFYAAPGSGRINFRLAFSSVSPGKFDEGVRRLAAAMREFEQPGTAVAV